MDQIQFEFKRGASPGVGKDYEKFATALIAARLFYNSSLHLSERQFDEFEVGINLKNMGKFDDVVILLKKNQKPLKNIAVQLKHKERGTLTDTMLIADEGNFALKVYQKSAESDVKFPIDQYVLYTNLPFNSKTVLENYDINQSKNHEVLSFLNTSPSDNVFKFTSKTNLFSENEKFFKNFSVYTNQKNVSEMEQEVHQTLREKFHADEHAQKVFVELCSYWCNNIRVENIVPHEPKLNRIGIGKMLVVCLLEPFLVTIQPPMEYHTHWEVLTKTAKKFTVTILHSEVCQNWTSAPLKDNDFSVWTEKCTQPIVVKFFEPRQSNQVLQAIHILNEIGLIKNLIVLGPLEAENLKEEIRIFKNLNNLDRNILAEVLTEFNIPLETLSQFFDSEIEVLDKVTPSVLFDIICNKNKEPKEELPECYFLRTFEVPIIYDFSVILNIFDNNIIVILTNEPDCVRSKLKNIIQTKIGKEESDVNHFNNIKIIKIITTINQQDLLNILNSYSDSNVYVFKLNSTNTNDEKLEFILSNGPSIQLLRNPSFKQINENVLTTDFYNKMNIICAEPGMGKTTTLKLLHNHLTSQNCYSKIISFKDHYRFFKNFNSNNSSIQSVLKYFLKIQNNAGLSDLVKLWYLNAGRVCLLFDAIDELDSKFLNSAIECVQTLLECSSYQLKVWISARNHLKNDLENIYKVHALNIRTISENEQKEYIRKRLIETHCNIEDVITNIYNNLQSFEQNVDICGTPLHIYILTEVLLDNYDLNTDLDNLLVLTKLYHEFFKGKLYDVQGKRIKLQKLDYGEFYDLNKYEIAALKVCLDENDFHKLNIPNYKKCIQIIKDSLVVGIVTGFSENDIPNFYHQSFAEYLCASYFTKHLDSNSILKNLIFKHKYNSIRLLFNMKLSEESHFHCALIYKNIDSIIDTDIEQIKSLKDNGGRNLLQLAISSGLNYPLWTLSNFNNNNVYREPIEINIDSKLENVIKYLINYLDLEEKDELFQWSSYEFAVNMNDLSIINIILDYNPNNSLLQNHCFSEKESILGYSAKYGFINLTKILCLKYSINLLNETKFNLIHNVFGEWCKAIHLAIENDQFDVVSFFINNNVDIHSENSYGSSPLFCAVANSQTKYLELIVSKGGHINTYSDAQEMLNSFVQDFKLDKLLQEYIAGNSDGNFNNPISEKEGVTALHWAAIKGQLESLKQHIAEDINNVNSKDIFGYSPLHWAILGGDLECLQELIANGAEINSTNLKVMSPLHFAISYDQFECLQELIANGAEVNSKWFNNTTALHCCVVKPNRLRFLQELITNGAEINSKNSVGFTPLFSAVQSGNLECVKELIANGADMNCKDYKGATAIHEAAFYGKSECLKELIVNGCDVNLANPNGKTPLHLSAQEGHLECLQELIALGAEINSSKNVENCTPLHSAILRRHLPCIQELIAKGADINAKDSDGRTPLSCAAFYGGLLQCIQDLIDKGAEINAKDSRGFTPLHLATEKGNLESLQKLITLGAEVNSNCLDSLTPLHIAAQKGHLECLQELIAKGANINAKNTNNRTPLHWAAYFEDVVQCIENLIDNGAEINCKDLYGFTPLHLATREGNLENQQKLISLGAEVNCKSSDGYTPLHLAAKGHLENLQKLIELGAEVNCKTFNGLTPLHLAVLDNQVECLQKLIAKGAEVNCKDSNEITPLHFAANQSHFECLKELIDKGADVNSKTFEDLTALHIAAEKGHLESLQKLIAKDANVNAKDTNNRTPLHLAAFFGGPLQIIQDLIANGAEINGKESSCGFTPLHATVQEGQLQSLQELIALGAEINSKDSEGGTPLHLAASRGQSPCLQELIAKGAEVNSKNSNGFTPLHSAAFSGHFQCLHDLIVNNAEVNSEDSNGYIPLHCSAQNGHLECLQELIAKGAEINYKNSYGCTPLHSAAFNGRFQCLQELIANGAEVNFEDPYGWTALHLAAQEGHLQCLQELIAKGCDINSKTKNGKTPLDIAEDPECRKVLINSGAE